MKRKKKNNLIIIGIITIIIIIFLVSTIQTPEDNFINIRLYDINGNLITPSLSVATIPSSYYMDITLNTKNTGSVPLACYPSSLSPNEWNDATNKIIKTVYPGYSTEWTSNLISLSNFSGKPQPTIFKAVVTCQYSDTQRIYYQNQSGSVNYTIGSVCGDNSCDGNETENSCPLDCFFGDKVVFRTLNSFYSGNPLTIGYTQSCGQNLLSFGKSSQTCWTVTDATCPTRPGLNLVIDQSRGLPGRPLWAGSSVGCLYINMTGSNPLTNNNLFIAWKTSSSGGPCTLTNQWGVIVFDPKSIYVLQELSPFANDTTRELSC